MQRAHLIFAALLLAAPSVPAQAVDPSIEFASPGQVGGNVTATGLQATLLVFHGRDAEISLDFEGDVRVTAHTRRFANFDAGEVGGYNIPLQSTDGDPESYGGRLAVGLTPSQDGPSSLYVEAESLWVAGNQSYGGLWALPAGSCVNSQLSDVESQEYLFRAEAGKCATADSVILRFDDPASQELPLSFLASGVRRAEWHNMATTCPTSQCPPGGSRTSSVWGNTEYYAATSEFQYVEATARDGTASYAGLGTAALGFGPSVDLDVAGWLRLPEAKGALCDGCSLDGNGTLGATGDLRLTGVRSGPDGRLAAGVAGTFTSVRLDEALLPEWVTPASVAGSAVVATVVAVLVAKLLAILARIRGDAEHPRRLTALEAIHANPGLSRNRLAQLTGIPLTSLRFHLFHLERKGQVVSHQEGSARRYFENHGRFAQTWQAAAVLQDANLRSLHEWVLRNPGLWREEVLRRVQAEKGWARATVGHRLQRLVAAGLVARRSEGGLATFWPDTGHAGLRQPVSSPSPG